MIDSRLGGFHPKRRKTSFMDWPDLKRHILECLGSWVFETSCRLFESFQEQKLAFPTFLREA